MLLDIGKDDTSPSSKSLHFPKLHKFVEMFFANHRAQVGVVILVDFFAPPNWWPNRLSMRLVI